MSVPTGSLPLARTDSHGHGPCNALTSTNLEAVPCPPPIERGHGGAVPSASDRIVGINLVRTAAV